LRARLACASRHRSRPGWRRQRAGITLDDLADLPIWLGWRSEDGTKIPYCVDGGMGDATTPETWRVRAECERDTIICLTFAWMMFDTAMAALQTTMPVGTVSRSKG
jgi:hypothetical protein